LFRQLLSPLLLCYRLWDWNRLAYQQIAFASILFKPSWLGINHNRKRTAILNARQSIRHRGCASCEREAPDATEASDANREQASDFHAQTVTRVSPETMGYKRIQRWGMGMGYVPIAPLSREQSGHFHFVAFFTIYYWFHKTSLNFSYLSEVHTCIRVPLTARFCLSFFLKEATNRHIFSSFSCSLLFIVSPLLDLQKLFERQN
jgi:hypothetical protein